MKNRKIILFAICFATSLCISSVASFAKKMSLGNKGLGIQFTNYLMGHPLLLNNGYTLNYYHPIWTKKRHQLALIPNIGFVTVPNTERKLFVGTSINYQFLTKHLYTNIGLGAQYTASFLQYKRFENVGGILQPKSNVLHNLGSTANTQFGYRVHLKKSFVLTPFIGVGLTQFNTGYKNALLEGHKLNFSIGLNITKK